MMITVIHNFYYRTDVTGQIRVRFRSIFFICRPTKKIRGAANGKQSIGRHRRLVRETQPWPGNKSHTRPKSLIIIMSTYIFSIFSFPLFFGPTKKKKEKKRKRELHEEQSVHRKEVQNIIIGL